MELGKKIKQLRCRSGLTQEQLAEKLGISPQSVSKWETAAAMPDITALPLLAGIFGTSIDDLFDLTVEQRFCRIESRMDQEEDLPQDVFLEYEEFLKSSLSSEQYRKQAAGLIAYLYWHRMETYARKVQHYAKKAIRMAPGEKGCQWLLQKAENHAVWDWNAGNHKTAVEFYRELVEENPQERLPYLYLLDNLIADHRADEAEKYLARLSALENADPVMIQVYRAHIALARFQEPEADRIMEDLIAAHPDDFACLFEAAQYYAEKCDYEKAVEYYERSFEKETRRPRYTDELQGIADICCITGDYGKAAETYDRMILLLKDEWGMTEETVLQQAMQERARLLAEVQKNSGGK